MSQHYGLELVTKDKGSAAKPTFAVTDGTRIDAHFLHSLLRMSSGKATSLSPARATKSLDILRQIVSKKRGREIKNESESKSDRVSASVSR